MALNRLFARASALVGTGALVVACGNVKNNDPAIDASDPGGDDATSEVCTPSAALRCEGASLVSCNAAGTAEVSTPCVLRCDGDALACQDRVDPSNALAAQLDAAIGQPALTLTTSGNLNTDDLDPNGGTLTVGAQQVKAALVPGSNGAPDIVVLSVGSLEIAAGVRFSVFGARVLAVMSAGDVRIAGTVDVRAGSATTAEACFGTDSGATGADNDVPGAGGAGFGTAGASGGNVIGIGAGKSGGAPTGAATLIPLRGGCSGGTDSLGGAGGGGGGAQITSATAITVIGTISANGTGGAVSSGGGSGGALLLEAPRVELAGGVFANGGGGGCGGFSAGANGSDSLSPARGADCGGNPGTGTGGNGGAGTIAPTNGSATLNRAGTVDRAGGGGGAVGRIRINTLDMTVVGAGLQSPPASVGVLAGR